MAVEHTQSIDDVDDPTRQHALLTSVRRPDPLQSAATPGPVTVRCPRRGAGDVFERLHLQGDPYVRELATIGYLEDLQNAAQREQIGSGSTPFVPFLGVESAR
ncbi:MAG TPA: hypothetical protein VF642_09520 [Propionibacteriaceae bacterium]